MHNSCEFMTSSFHLRLHPVCTGITKRFGRNRNQFSQLNGVVIIDMYNNQIFSYFVAVFIPKLTEIQAHPYSSHYKVKLRKCIRRRHVYRGQLIKNPVIKTTVTVGIVLMLVGIFLNEMEYSCYCHTTKLYISDTLEEVLNAAN